MQQRPLHEKLCEKAHAGAEGGEALYYRELFRASENKPDAAEDAQEKAGKGACACLMQCAL